MMNKELCKRTIQYINPGENFTDRTMAYLRREQEQARRCVKRVRIAVAGLAAVACIAVAVFVLPGLLRGAPEEQPSPVAISTPTNDTVSTQPTATQLVLDGSPVPYSSLNFDYTEGMQYPDVADQTQSMCLMAFRESMLEQSQLVALATVEDVRFNQYFRNIHTALYTLHVDKVFYSELDVAEGDTFTVEQVLYGGTLSDSEFSLKPGGRYILPIYADPGVVKEYDFSENVQTAAKESRYTLVYPFQPMIELTSDGGYLFFGERDAHGSGFGWKSLVSEDTVEVVMDVETASGADSWIDRMKLRADDRFEDDFQALVNYYCVEGGAENDGGLETVPLGSEITNIQAMSIGEAMLSEGLEVSQGSCYFDVIHQEWKLHFEFFNTENVYDIRLSPAGDVIDAVWR